MKPAKIGHVDRVNVFENFLVRFVPASHMLRNDVTIQINKNHLHNIEIPRSVWPEAAEQNFAGGGRRIKSGSRNF